MAKKTDQNNRDHKAVNSNTDVAQAALAFSKNVLGENFKENFHGYSESNYLDMQMIFETDELVSYSSYSNKLYEDKSAQGNYDGFLLFVATYKDQKAAEFAFQELKANTPIRIAELEGFAGLLVEQVQVFERIRKSGGLLTQKDKYVFHLLENCGEPPVGKDWRAYEKLFLEAITEKNETIEVINADCGKDRFLIQKTDLLKSGIQIEHGGYRGTGYTDSLGREYNLRNNPITITNDSSVSMHVQIAFQEEYDYTDDMGDEKFRVIPLPKEWAREGTTDSMFEVMWLTFENHLDRPILSDTIEPGERFVFALGTLYPKPAEPWWVVPNELFAHTDLNTYPDCNWRMEKDPRSNSEINLGLKLLLGEGCRIIPCGRITYLND